MFVGHIEFNDCIARVIGFHSNRATYVTKYLRMFVRVIGVDIRYLLTHIRYLDIYLPNTISKVSRYDNFLLRTALNLVYLSKTVLAKLELCSFYWRHLATKDRLDKYGALKSEEVSSSEGQIFFIL